MKIHYENCQLGPETEIQLIICPGVKYYAARGFTLGFAKEEGMDADFQHVFTGELHLDTLGIHPQAIVRPGVVAKAIHDRAHIRIDRQKDRVFLQVRVGEFETKGIVPFRDIEIYLAPSRPVSLDRS